MKQRLSELGLVTSSVIIFFFVVIGMFAGHEMDRHDRKDMEKRHKKEIKEEKKKNQPKPQEEKKKEEKKKDPEYEKSPYLYEDDLYSPWKEWEKQDKRTSSNKIRYNYNILCHKDNYKGVPKEEHPHGVRLIG